MSLGEALAPALKQVVTWLSKMVKPIQSFVNEHRELFIVLAKGLALFLILGGAIATVGVILGGMGLALKSIGSVFVLTGGMVKGFAITLGAVFGLAGKAVSGIVWFVKVLTNMSKTAPALAFILTHPWMATINGILLATWTLNMFARRLTGLGAFMNSIVGRVLNVFNIINPLSWARKFIEAFSLILSEFMKIGNVMAGWSVATWAWLAGIVAVVAAVGYIVYKTNALGKAWQWLKGVWQDTCDYFSDKWSETTNAIGDSLGVIWDAVMLGNFRQAWSLLCKDMLVTWDIWTLEVSDVWDALCANLRNVWAGLWYGGVIKAYEWASNRILTGLEHIKGKFAAGWEWIAGSCKAAFQIVVLWFQNVLDDITTAIAKTMNRIRSYMPGTGYTSEDADRENAMLDRMTQQSKSKRESGTQIDIVDSDSRLRQIEAQTQDRLRQLNDDLRSKMDMYDSLVAQLKEQSDSELTAEMQRRRQDIERLKQEIARETADLRAQNEAMKQENAIQHEDYGRVWEDIEANTAETARNTAQKEATADVSARAITMRWGGLDVFASIIRGAMRGNVASVAVPAPTVREQAQIGESVTVSGTDMTRMAEIGAGIGAMREALTAQSVAHGEYTKSMGEKMQRLLDKLTELTRNTRRYADNIEDMLTVR